MQRVKHLIPFLLLFIFLMNMGGDWLHHHEKNEENVSCSQHSDTTHLKNCEHKNHLAKETDHCDYCLFHAKLYEGVEKLQFSFEPIIFLQPVNTYVFHSEKYFNLSIRGRSPPIYPLI